MFDVSQTHAVSVLYVRFYYFLLYVYIIAGFHDDKFASHTTANVPL